MTTLRLPAANRRKGYCGIFLLNRSFDLIVQRLDELGQPTIFKTRDLREMCGFAQEVQLEINTMLLNALEAAEQRDHAQFGKVRIAMERRLKERKP
jgi:hypothetical protein